jgi:hypothetical protein
MVESEMGEKSDLHMIDIVLAKRKKENFHFNSINIPGDLSCNFTPRTEKSIINERIFRESRAIQNLVIALNELNIMSSGTRIDHIENDIKYDEFGRKLFTKKKDVIGTKPIIEQDFEKGEILVRYDIGKKIDSERGDNFVDRKEKRLKLKIGKNSEITINVSSNKKDGSNLETYHNNQIDRDEDGILKKEELNEDGTLKKENGKNQIKRMLKIAERVFYTLPIGDSNI